MAWGPSQHGGVRQARSHTGAILLGAMTEGCEGWQEWPIDPDRLPRSGPA